MEGKGGIIVFAVTFAIALAFSFLIGDYKLFTQPSSMWDILDYILHLVVFFYVGIYLSFIGASLISYVKCRSEEYVKYQPLLWLLIGFLFAFVVIAAERPDAYLFWALIFEEPLWLAEIISFFFVGVGIYACIVIYKIIKPELRYLPILFFLWIIYLPVCLFKIAIEDVNLLFEGTVKLPEKGELEKVSWEEIVKEEV